MRSVGRLSWPLVLRPACSAAGNWPGHCAGDVTCAEPAWERKSRMPGGERDSSKTRVRPVFDLLSARTDDWIPELLALPSGGCDGAEIRPSDLRMLEGYWEPREKCLDPPVSLLSWLIRNAPTLATGQSLEGL